MNDDKFFTSAPVDGPRDILIIGSGMSALCAGAMLSAAGKKVLLLEQHFQPGGFTHTFTRKNFEWDVGLHYVGKASKTSPWHHQVIGLTDGAIRFEPFHGLLDELYFPDFHLLVPNDYEGYEANLAAAFPKEADGIHRYMETVRYMRRRLQLYFGMNLLPRPLTRFARQTAIRRPHQLATRTTEQVMSRYLRDDHLKAVMDAQWGNIGSPRQHCSFLVHAAMMGNYLEEGAEYPIGGSGVFAREFGRVICRNGGAIRVKAKVQRLIIRNNRVEGVVLDSGEEVRAGVVISSIGVGNTYSGLLRDEPSCAAAIAELQKHQPAYEYLNLFIGFHKSPAEFGLGNGNTWIHPFWNTASDDPTWDVSDLAAHPVPKVLFFSSSSLRDPDLKNRPHGGWNGQIVTAVKTDSFARWRGSKWNHREDAYYRLKDAISDRLMSLLDSRYPGIRDNVAFSELGTTLTYEHFTSSLHGIPYGLAPIPSRYGSLLMRPTTPVKNLYLCGQDLIMPGVPAAVGSANMCCSLILRTNAGSPWCEKGRKIG